MTIKENKVIACVVTITAALVSAPAHHAMDSAIPATTLHGLISELPMLFVLSTVLGAVTLLAGFNIIFSEACVSAVRIVA